MILGTCSFLKQKGLLFRLQETVMKPTHLEKKKTGAGCLVFKYVAG